MEYRTIGRDGLKVSVIGLGGNVFGAFLDRPQTERLIGAAQDRGINLVDTANVYSDGISEEYIGSAIQAQGRKNWVIETKIGLHFHANPAGLGRKKHILEMAEGSLRRLKTDYIDFYLMHHPDPITPVSETIEAFEELVRSGKIRFYGLSNLLPSDRKMFREYLVSQLKPASVQHHYNVFRRELETDGIMQDCQEAGVGIIAYAVLARGILGGGYSQGQPIRPGSRAETSSSVRSDLVPEVLSAAQAFQELARRLGLSPTQLAILWALRLQTVKCCLLGIRSVRQLMDAAGADGKRITPGDINGLDAIFGNPLRFERYNLGSGSVRKIDNWA